MKGKTRKGGVRATVPTPPGGGGLPLFFLQHFDCEGLTQESTGFPLCGGVDPTEVEEHLVEGVPLPQNVCRERHEGGGGGLSEGGGLRHRFVLPK